MEAARAAPEVVVAGHISLDVAPRLCGPLQIEPGRLLVVGPAVISTGGVVCNTGLALHRLGVRVGLIAKVGDDLFGRSVLDALSSFGDHLATGIVVAPGEPTSYTIVINPPGVDRTFLHCSGANQTFCSQDVPDDELTGVRLFHFGYPPLMPRMYADGGAELRAMYERVREHGAATSLDLCVPDPESDAGRVDWREILARALPFVDLFAPSLDELLVMFEGERHAQPAAFPPEVPDHAQLATLGGLLTRMGATVVVIKLGDQGLYLRTTPDAARMRAFCERIGLQTDAWLDRELLAPCFRPRAVNGTTGSGDATIGGFLAALLRGAGPAQAATWATAVGACSVEAVDPTSGIPRWDRLVRRVADGWPRQDVRIRLSRGVDASYDETGTMVFR